MSLANDTGFLQLVHQATCTVVADGKLTLDETRRAALLMNNQAGGIVEHRIKVTQIGIIAAAFTALALDNGLRQFVRLQIALLLGNELVDIVDLWRIDKGTLHTHGVVALQIEHVAAANELLGTHAVEDGLRVDALAHLKGYAGRKVGLDSTRDDIRGGSLRGNNHVDAHGTRLLGNTCNRQLYLLAGCHNQVAILVDDHHDIRHVFMASLRIQFAGNELAVIVLDIAFTGSHQQFVAGIHLYAE